MSNDSYPGQSPKREGTLLKFSHLVEYSEGQALQEKCHAERREDRRTDTLILLEHQPVYTLGRRTAPSHLPRGRAALLATGATVESANRGGSVTYHGPGQLVGYPILKLAHFATGPKQYVCLLAQMLIRTLTIWDIEASRLKGKPGLFVRSPDGMAKIASIGVRIDRGITMHGFALNVDLDLAPFSYIVPCGLSDSRVTSIAEQRGSSVPVSILMRQVADEFGEVFKLEWNSFQPGVIEQQATSSCLPTADQQAIKEQILHA